MQNDFNKQIIDEFRANAGQVGGVFAGARLVLLTTTGARTGRPHTVPVGYLPDDGGRLLVIASAAGAPNHPAWFHNLRTNPRVTVETGVFTIEAEALVLAGEERDRLFARAVDADPGWAEYQAKTDRVIPVVALTPTGGSPPAGAEGDVLTRIHDAFRRELAVVRAEVAASGPGLGAQLRINCVTLCGGLHHHHAAESDGLFPYLEDRYPELDPVLGRLYDEHASLSRLLDELQQLVAADAPDRTALLADVDRLVAEVEAHLDYEERQLVPILNALPPREHDRLTVDRVAVTAEEVQAVASAMREVVAAPRAAADVAGPWVNVTDRSAESAGVTLYVHGGGFEHTDPALERRLAGCLSAVTDRPVYAVAQRLAPAHPYPAPVDDVVAAYRGLLDQGVPAGEILLFGESSGGTLVLSALLTLRAQGVALPAGGVVVSPLTDLTLSSPSIDRADGADPLRRPMLEHVRDQYLGAARPDGPPQSPLHGDLCGLPPLLLAVGASEVLLDDARRFAATAARAGGHVELHVYEGLTHGFHLAMPATPPPPPALAFQHRLTEWTRARTPGALR